MSIVTNLKWMVLVAAAFLYTAAASGQGISADSVKALNNNNKMLRMAISINEQKLQLARLQNQVLAQDIDVNKTAAASKKSAGKNEDAAASLNGDDQDKHKANVARKSARTAQRNSSDARHAQDKMEGLTQDVRNLEKEIADKEQQLVTMGGAKYLQ